MTVELFSKIRKEFCKKTLFASTVFFSICTNFYMKTILSSFSSCVSESCGALGFFCFKPPQGAAFTLEFPQTSVIGSKHLQNWKWRVFYICYVSYIKHKHKICHALLSKSSKGTSFCTVTIWGWHFSFFHLSLLHLMQGSERRVCCYHCASTPFKAPLEMFTLVCDLDPLADLRVPAAHMQTPLHRHSLLSGQ